jgi:hypothetical protein
VTNQSDPEDVSKNMQAEPMIEEPSALPKTVEAEIGSGLKRLYGQMLSEPMPEKFAGLLEQLAKSSGSKTESSS